VHANAALSVPSIFYPFPNFERVPAGLNNIHNHMFDAVEHGVFNNAQTVHSYHPPVQDPVTGVYVDIPATVFVRHHSPYDLDPMGLKVNEYVAVSNTNPYISSSHMVHRKESDLLPTPVVPFSKMRYKGTHANGQTREFDIGTGPLGTHVSYLYPQVANANLITEAIDMSQDPHQYAKGIQSLYPETPGNMVARSLGRRVRRVTDQLDNAQDYITNASNPPALTDTQKQNISQLADPAFRYVPRDMKTLNSSYVPIHTPGIMNGVSVLKLPNAGAFSRPTYHSPFFPKNTGY
jgi:hypothetical protein